MKKVRGKEGSPYLQASREGEEAPSLRGEGGERRRRNAGAADSFQSAKLSIILRGKIEGDQPEDSQR